MVTSLFAELVALAIFTALAGMNDQLGKVFLILMWGFVLGWMLLHTAQFAKMVKAL